mmetsp:Transcript_20876/g.30042  ORF Transcript_20876/g.30042 Transcript_20876/m.30042 type:complete len:378 (-) Transcript_20876:276-1409(-)
MICYSYPSPYAADPSLLELKPVIHAMGISDKDITQFHSAFSRIGSHCDSVSVSEVLNWLGVSDTVVSRRVFCVSQSAPMTMMFLDFLVCVWNVCSLRTDDIFDFAFDLLRLCHSNHPSCGNATVLRRLYGERHFRKIESDKRLQRELDTVQLLGLNRDEFHMFCKSNRTFLSPLLELQLKLRKKVLGVRCWRKLAKIRFRSEAESMRHISTYQRTLQNMLSPHMGKGNDSYDGNCRLSAEHLRMNSDYWSNKYNCAALSSAIYGPKPFNSSSKPTTKGTSNLSYREQTQSEINIDFNTTTSSMGHDEEGDGDKSLCVCSNVSSRNSIDLIKEPELPRFDSCTRMDEYESSEEGHINTTRAKGGLFFCNKVLPYGDKE